MTLRLPRIVFFGRATSEYERLWNLEATSLAGRRVLDCPCGPSDFVASCRAGGVEAVGVDPVLGLDPEAILHRGLEDIDETLSRIETEDPALAGGDPEGWARDKRASLDAFLADFRRHRPGTTDDDGRYRAGSLPTLDLEDRSFDLVLSAHLLLAYAPVEHGGLVDDDASLDLDFHLAAVEELARVCRDELRLYPALAIRSDRPTPHPWLPHLRSRLDDLGFRTETRNTTYDQGFGTADAVLVARRR